MTTQAMTGPRIVAPHPNAEQAAKMANLLAARSAIRHAWDRIAAAPRRAWGFLVRVLHLEPAIELAKSSTHWLTASAKRGLDFVSSTIGLPEAAAMLGTSHTGQSLVRAVTTPIAKGVSWIASKAYNGFLSGLGLFGDRGKALATNIDSWVCDHVFAPVATKYAAWSPKVAEWLNPKSDQMRAVQAVAIASAGRRIIARFLPSPWNYVAMILGSIVLAYRYGDLLSDAVGDVKAGVDKAEAVLAATVLPVAGTAVVEGPRGGKQQVDVVGVTVPTAQADQLPETVASVVVTAASPDGAPDGEAVVPNREARREQTRHDKKQAKPAAGNRR